MEDTEDPHGKESEPSNGWRIGEIFAIYQNLEDMVLRIAYIFALS